MEQPSQQRITNFGIVSRKKQKRKPTTIKQAKRDFFIYGEKRRREELRAEIAAGEKTERILRQEARRKAIALSKKSEQSESDAQRRAQRKEAWDANESFTVDETGQRTGQRRLPAMIKRPRSADPDLQPSQTLGSSFEVLLRQPYQPRIRLESNCWNGYSRNEAGQVEIDVYESNNMRRVADSKKRQRNEFEQDVRHERINNDNKEKRIAQYLSDSSQYGDFTTSDAIALEETEALRTFELRDIIGEKQSSGEMDNWKGNEVTEGNSSGSPTEPNTPEEEEEDRVLDQRQRAWSLPGSQRFPVPSTWESNMRSGIYLHSKQDKGGSRPVEKLDQSVNESSEDELPTLSALVRGAFDGKRKRAVQDVEEHKMIDSVRIVKEDSSKASVVQLSSSPPKSIQSSQSLEWVVSSGGKDEDDTSIVEIERAVWEERR